MRLTSLTTRLSAIALLCLAPLAEASGITPVMRTFSSGYLVPGGIAVDSAQNIYIAGITSVPLYSPLVGGMYDAYVTRYTPTGSQVWVSQSAISNVDSEVTASLVLDPTEGLYLLLKTYVFGSNGAYSHAEHFLAHLDVNGTLLWKRPVSLGDPGAEAYKLLAAGPGEFYLVGYTLTPPGGVVVDENVGYSDVFVARIGEDGGLLSYTPQRTPRFDYPYNATATPFGVVVVGVDCESYACNDADGFVMKWTSMGNLEWLTRIQSVEYDEASDVAVDGMGRVLVSGFTRSNIFDAGFVKQQVGDADAALWVFDSLGGLTWSDQFGTLSDDFATSVAVDATGNVYLGGHSTASVNGTPNAGAADWFIAKYSGAALSGTSAPLWSVMGGTADYDYTHKLVVSNGVLTLNGGDYSPTNYSVNDVFVLQTPAVRGGL